MIQKEVVNVQNQTGVNSFYTQMIVAILYIVVIAVPLYYDIRLYSVFDLSKVTVLYILVFSIIVIWSLKTLSVCWKDNKHPDHTSREEMQGVSEKSSIIGYPYASFSAAKPLHLPVLVLVGISAITTFFSISPFTSLLGTYKRYDGLVSTLVYVVLFYTVVHFIDRKRVSVFLDVIISTACVASVYGIFQHFGVDLYKWSTDFGFGIRVSATFGHPAFFSAYLVMVIPLVLVKIFSRKSWAQSGLYMAVLALLLTAFYYTKTRAAFLGLLISIIFFFSLTGWKTLFTNKVKTAVTLSILISISVSLNMSDQSSVMGRFAQDVHYTQDKNPDSLEAETGYTNMLGGTMFMRAFQYRTGIEIIKDYPVLGIGADTLGIIYPQYIARVYKKWNEHRNFQNQNRIHNDILDMTVSRGFLGLGAYVWFIFTYAVMVWKGYREADEKNKILITGLCSGCLAYFIQNQFSFGHVPIITMLWFLVGLSVITCSSRSYLSGVVNGKINTDIHPQPGNRDRVTKRGGVLRSERLIKVVLCGCIVGFMVMLVIGSSARYKADVYFSRARKLLKKNSTIEAIECYETAARLNPFELTYRTVLNEIYLRMAAITLNKRKEHIKRGLPESFTNEQATLWLNNTILGAEEVQKLYPNDYRSAFTLGQAYHTLGHISARDLSSKAMVHYQKAVTLYPFKYQIHIKLAQLYNEMGQCEKAIFVLNEAIRFVPGEPGLHLRLAKSLIKCGRYREARETCNRILELEGAKEEKFKQNTREMLLFLDKKEARKTMPVPGAAE